MCRSFTKTNGTTLWNPINNNGNPLFESIGTLFQINRRRKVNRQPLKMNWRLLINL